MKLQKVIEQMNMDRIADDLLSLLEIPSPTGNERAVALKFKELLMATGDKIEVSVEGGYPKSPSVIGILSGSRPGKTLQLSGHLDHIDVPHDAPKRDGNIISGRGSCDMKCGLAGILELVRILQENDSDFPGRVLITVYGLHEEPGGNTQGVANLIKKNIKGDAAIIMEGPMDKAIVMAMGLARWDLTLKHSGPICHENVADPHRHELLDVSLEVIGLLKQKNDVLKKKRNSYALINRAESIFIGQMHYGDFFNRMPNEFKLQGTVRWHPDRSYEEVQAEMNKLIESISCSSDISINFELTFIGHSCQIDSDEQIVQSLISSYKSQIGKDLEIAGWTTVTDSQRLIREAGVPTVVWGANLENAHMDYEFVELDKLKSACEVIFHTAVDYLNSNGSN